MFGSKKRDAARPQSVARLGWDLHAHLLPCVDDGVRSLEEAVEAVRALQALGYCGCIVTPHVYKDLYNNSREVLISAFMGLQNVIRESGIDFGLRLAAEYFGDDHFIQLAESGNLLDFGTRESRYVLIEFPYIGEPLYWADALSVITRSGYQPVIAHPERYRYVAADLNTWLTRFGNYPVKYQCDLGSLVGQYGREAARAARYFLDKGLAGFWGSDLHRPSQVDRFIRPAIDLLDRSSAINFEAQLVTDGTRPAV